ncbi:hypothetical protein E9549_02790 [Blastococcus sp. MG754426]|uniref:hypothetical protein n=1 Tax=unclassified Blastococcus TaxID=2619396 RepID=UPI001EF0614A|nr:MULTISPECIES: hypothetical protein [unclassified Blastococcus]MCF6506339.1 hypothetical protein [Blastococcus sp. MG754426]MCF6510845.1 hypothetical protein [Blastococcus sp. MG754427]MCF6733813.1 hypothetical protein [Blastococcus sp. KM273129]
MTEGSRTGAPRDVPPPRPVAQQDPPATTEESPLARAGRAVADAVAGLTGGGTERSAGGGLRDVVGAVAGAVASALGGGAQPAPEASGARVADGDGRAPGALLGDLLAAAAPRLPIRDRERLRAAHPGASDDEIAEALVQRAARATSGIGAATGGLSAAHWFAPPSLLAVPLELGAETVLVAAVEVVLIGELHELSGRRAPGDAAARAQAYLAAWSEQRAVRDGGVAGLGAVLGAAGVRALRRRVTRRLAGALPAAAPFLVGAALSGRGNRRATESLARRIREDLQGPPV